MAIYNKDERYSYVFKRREVTMFLFSMGLIIAGIVFAVLGWWVSFAVAFGIAILTSIVCCGYAVLV